MASRASRPGGASGKSRATAALSTARPVETSQASCHPEHIPSALPDYAAVDAALTALLSVNLRLWQTWFVSMMTPHRIEGLPLAGASQHDLPKKPARRST